MFFNFVYFLLCTIFKNGKLQSHYKHLSDYNALIIHPLKKERMLQIISLAFITF